MEHLGKRVSLLTSFHTRFEGDLTAISTQQCCVQLDNLIIKGLENRDPPDPIESTKNPKEVESLRFFQHEISNITLLNNNQELTDIDITCAVIHLFEEHTTNNDGDHKQDTDYLFCIGLIADPQYADTQSRFNYAKTKIRRYRNGLKITKNAIKTWNETDKPSLIICCGDIIDGLNKKRKSSIKCMKAILSEFNKFKPSKPSELMQNMMNHPLNTHYFVETKDEMIPTFPYFHNLIGNHELYNFNQKELMQYLYSPININNHQKWECSKCGLINSMQTQQCKACFVTKERNNIMTPTFYYSFSPFPQYIFIILNCYQVSVLGYNYCNGIGLNYMDSSHYNLKEYTKVFNIEMKDENKDKNIQMHPNKRIAMEMLTKHNNGDMNNFPCTLDDEQRWVHFNGAFGATQLKWLENTLIEIEKLGAHNVILFGHIPIWCTLSDNNMRIRGNERTLCWDYKEINQIIAKYKCVKMYIAGHKHSGECVIDPNGIWHRALEGAIEAPLNADCFGTMFLYRDKAVLKGYGIDSGVFQFR